MIPTPGMLANPTEKESEFQHDLVALKKFDFTNPRTWEVIETKGSKRPFLTHGTWEDAENEAVVGNVRNRSFCGDKLSQDGEDFAPFSRGMTGVESADNSRYSRPKNFLVFR